MSRAVLFDLGPTYLGTHLSDNIAETPEGFLICRNAVLGRSGFQTYFVSELDDPDGLLVDHNPTEEIQIWRSPEEVFSTATIGSFEGKSFTINHPEILLGPDSDGKHSVGHVQNVRKGPEPLESGDWPLLGDIIVKDEDAIRAIQGGLRELSCGYSYKLAKEGYRFEQRNIWGNHLALVPKGRAGHEARINDSIPSKGLAVKKTWKQIFGFGLKEYAKDATPEDLTAAIEEFRGANENKPKGLRSIGFTADGIEVFAREVSKDADPDPAMDQKAKDRKKLHDALDKQLDTADAAAAEKGKEDDEAMDALKKMFGSADASDAEHTEDCDCEKCKGGNDGDEGKVEPANDGEVTSPEPVLSPSEVPESQFDSAAVLIKALKPIIAKSKDARVRKAFDTAVTALDAARKNEKGNGSYARFTSATRHVAGDQDFSESVDQKAAREFDAMYAEEMSKRTAHFKAPAKK